MATVYLMLVHWIDDGDRVDDVRTRCGPRVFSAPSHRADAARRFIDEQIASLHGRVVRSDLATEMNDIISDMRSARAAGDLRYEMMCCHDLFQFELEFHDAAVELEEMLGELVK